MANSIVDALGDADGVIHAGDAQHVPADLSLESVGKLFLEIIPLEPKLRLIVLRTFAVINTHDIEFPIPATVHGGFDGDAIADLPVNLGDGGGADNGALPVLQEVIPLIVGNDEFREHLALSLRIDDELRKEILFFLVDAAEPVVVGHIIDAGNSEYFVAIGKRDSVDDRSAVNDQQCDPPRPRPLRG